MKRFISVVLACLLIFTLNACSNGAQDVTNQPAGEPNQSAGEPNQSAATEGPQAKPANFPKKEIELVVPLNPGGGTDLMCRKLAEIIQKEYGVNIVVSNAPGSGGVVGAAQVLAMESDGYTWTLIGATAISQMIRGEFGYTMNDITWLQPLYGMNHVLLVNADGKYETAEDFIKAATDNPGTVSIGHNGTYNTAQAGLIALGRSYGNDNLFLSMPFDGASRAITELIGGNIDAVCVGIGDVLSYLKEGTVKPLLVLSFDKLEAFPDIANVGDLGLTEDKFENVTYVRWLMCGPGGIDNEITSYVANLFKGAMETEEFKKYAYDAAYDIDTTSGEAMVKLADDYYKVVETWNKYFD